MSSDNIAAPANATYTIAEFCLAHRISRTALYDLWNAGNGPRRIQIGTGRSSKVLISVEAAKAWRRQREKVTKQKVEKATKQMKAA
jgi:hypothetical protein